jgi:hypothetical protein
LPNQYPRICPTSALPGPYPGQLKPPGIGRRIGGPLATSLTMRPLLRRWVLPGRLGVFRSRRCGQE